PSRGAYLASRLATARGESEGSACCSACNVDSITICLLWIRSLPEKAPRLCVEIGIVRRGSAVHGGSRCRILVQGIFGPSVSAGHSLCFPFHGRGWMALGIGKGPTRTGATGHSGCLKRRSYSHS